MNLFPRFPGWARGAGAVPAILMFSSLLFLAACSGQAPESHRLTIGLVTNNRNGVANVQGFKEGMAELGYVEGENVTYLSTDSPVQEEELEAFLKRAVKEVDLIFTAGTPTGVAAHKASEGTGVPVVFGVIADPILAGVMEDLTNPGGNMTGVMLSPSQSRRLELFRELVPAMERLFVPYNPDDAAPVSALKQISEVAPSLGIELIPQDARNDDEMTELLANVPFDIDGIFLLPDTVVNARLEEIVALAIERKLPLSGPTVAQAKGGALTAYGIVHHKVGVQAARIADQILSGADPGTLPVETAEFYLAVNLLTAEAIGLEIPYSILQQSEIIIRGEE